MDVNLLNGKIIVKIGTKRSIYDKTSSNWDESGEGRVKKILITHGVDAINSIQMVYEQNGKLKLAPRHGGDGDNFLSICLYLDEYVTSVRGHFGSTTSANSTVIRSLRFDTNLGSFGPFGCEEGTPFSFNITSRLSFCGFHGCSDSMYLTAIGVSLDISNMRRFQFQCPTEPSDAPRRLLYEAGKILPALPPA